jgi:hypothetical protein
MEHPSARALLESCCTHRGPKTFVEAELALGLHLLKVRLLRLGSCRRPETELVRVRVRVVQVRLQDLDLQLSVVQELWRASDHGVSATRRKKRDSSWVRVQLCPTSKPAACAVQSSPW